MNNGKLKQRIGTVALIQIGFFLSAAIASMIGGAWTNVMQSDFNANTSVERENLHLITTATSTPYNIKAKALQDFKDSASKAKNRNLRYALFVTTIGLIIIIGWTLFVQEIDPTLVSYIEPY
jgi:hypothetical protein